MKSDRSCPEHVHNHATCSDCYFEHFLNYEFKMKHNFGMVIRCGINFDNYITKNFLLLVFLSSKNTNFY